MKKLTQEIFKGAPDWVKSAAVDSDGYAYLYQESVESLILYEIGFGKSHWSTGIKSLGGNYNATDWKNSAIGREVL